MVSYTDPSSGGDTTSSGGDTTSSGTSTPNLIPVREFSASDVGVGSAPRIGMANLNAANGPDPTQFVMWAVDVEGDDTLVALDEDGVTQLWTATTGQNPTQSVIPWWGVGMGDVDGDGLDEVAVGISDVEHGDTEQGAVRLLDGDGTTMFTDSTTYAKVEAVTTGDIDGDGNDEVVAIWRQSDGSGALVSYDETGTIDVNRNLGGTDYNHHRGMDMGVWCRDIDNDGRDEILNGGDNGGFARMWNYDTGGLGNVSLIFSSEFAAGEHGDDVSFRDLDGDGEIETAIAAGTGDVELYQANGTLAWTDSVPFEYQAIATGLEGGSGYVYGVEKNGDRLRKLNASDGSLVWEKNLGDPYLNSAIGASDVDGDGDDEVILSAGHHTLIYVYNADGTVNAIGGPGGRTTDVGSESEGNQGSVVDLGSTGRETIVSTDETDRLTLFEYWGGV